MTKIAIHKRLRDMRDEAIRRPPYRPVYLHALGVAHMGGRLIADDHPAWPRVLAALAEIRHSMATGGTAGAGQEALPEILNRLERELMRLRD